MIPGYIVIRIRQVIKDALGRKRIGGCISFDTAPSFLRGLHASRRDVGGGEGGALRKAHGPAGRLLVFKRFC